MSHFAEVDDKGIVLRVIVAEQDFIDSGVVGDPKRWVQTSYSGTFKGSYAGIGYTYSEVLDSFVAPVVVALPAGNVTISGDGVTL